MSSCSNSYEQQEWRKAAACKGAHNVFLADGDSITREQIDQAKAICRGCEVRPRCKDEVDAIEARQATCDWVGIWNGETPWERGLRRRKRASQMRHIKKDP